MCCAIFIDSFASDARVDKYGRKVSLKDGDGYLKKYYRPEDEDEEGEARGPDLARGDVLLESSDEEEENEYASGSHARMHGSVRHSAPA